MNPGRWFRPVIGVLLAGLLAACGRAPDAPPWLLGSWTLTHNPNHDDNDSLSFLPHGKVQIRTEDGRTLDGVYQLSDQALVISIMNGQRPVEARFTVSSDHARLQYSNGAYYTRQGK
ncbi:MAG: hypothetical protein HY940_04565 [Gammaproteobacteria bacterium]|nr:hypothetical protein [Gammaproteobacteria bacterium]